MAGRCLCWCGNCSRSMRTGPMPRRCHESRLIAIIWPGRQRRIAPARLLPGGTLWRGWKRPRAWPRMIPEASQSRLMEHQHLGLAEVQGLAGLGELFDTLVVFENYPVDRAGLSAEVGGLRLTDFRGLDATHYPLSLAAHPGERLQLQLSYRPDLFDRSSVEAITGRLVRLLEGAVADPDRAIGKLDILGADERRTILREWNATARAVPGATLPELFAAQVARTPEADAVVFEDERLSYGELDARSSRLAHHLRGLGVGP